MYIDTAVERSALLAIDGIRKASALRRVQKKTIMDSKSVVKSL